MIADIWLRCSRCLRPATVAAGVILASGAHGQCALEKLLAPDGDEQDNFGAGIAIDGDVIVVGAPDVTGETSGAAYVYRFDGEAWGFEQKLIPSEPQPAQYFGYSVAIHESAIIAGAWGDTVNDVQSGSAWVFRHTRGGWIEEAMLAPADAADGDRFGFSVDIDAQRAIVGAIWNSDEYQHRGAAFVFRRDGDVWTQEAKLLASDGEAGDWFGQAVALDNDVAIVTISRNELGGPAYAYRRNGTTWQEEGTLEPPGSAGTQFGIAAAMHGDVAVIGASFDHELGEKAGAAYVFHQVDAEWAQRAKLLASDGQPDDQFGHSVGSDGQTVIVGARWDQPYGYQSGSAYLFESDGGSWIESSTLIAPDGEEGDRFGFAVGVDGDIAAVGALRDQDNGPESGSAHVFDTIGPDCNENGICDWIDIANGTSEDVNGNGIPDECEELCPEDLSGDGEVNTVDLLILLGAWGTPDGDVDGDGDTDTADLLALLGAWGDCP
ncbi:MAG: FG-GAP repeat protein [Planctomycetota bacterium]|nr:FG-GAP repeat protein [Planctomycetota bacterium]